MDLGWKKTWFAVSRAVAVSIVSLTSLALAAQVHGAGNALTGSRRPLDANASMNQQYRLQVGDVVAVTFRYTPEFSEDVTVGPDGFATFRAAGELKVLGMTLPDLQALVTTDAASRLVHPEIALTLKEFDRPHVYVAGEVNAPGRQDLRRPTTALQAILMCGGPKDDAALGRVLLFRKLDSERAEVHVLQLAHYGRRSREENDMVLQPDDMILVRHDLPSRIERIVKLTNFGLYLNPLQNVGSF